MGVAAVAAAALASTTVLVVHGASVRPHAVELAEQRVPLDMSWLVFNDCQDQVGFMPDLMWSVDQDQDGRLRVEYLDHAGAPVEDTELLAREQDANTCLADYRFAPADDVSIWEERSVAERLLILDVYQRAVRPCLAARGVDIGAPNLEQYLDPQMIPWADVYWIASGVNGGESGPPVEDLLAMREDCGLPSDMLAHG